MVNVVPIFVALAQNLLHQKYIGVTYARTSNFIMEPIRSMPLYSMAMPYSVITIIEVLFVSTLLSIIVGIKSRPHIPRGT